MHASPLCFKFQTLQLLNIARSEKIAREIWHARLSNYSIDSCVDLTIIIANSFANYRPTLLHTVTQESKHGLCITIQDLILFIKQEGPRCFIVKIMPRDHHFKGQYIGVSLSFKFLVKLKY